MMLQFMSITVILVCASQLIIEKIMKSDVCTSDGVQKE